MTADYLVTSQATRDLAEIWHHIALDSPRNAGRVLARFRSTLEAIARMPGIGHARADVPAPRYRFVSVYRYLVVYRVEVKPIQVVRVIHGHRDVPRALE